MTGNDVVLSTFEGDADEAFALILPICRSAFGAFTESYLTDRYPRVTDPLLLVATLERQPVGFKLGYRRGGDLFYIWLGAVTAQGRGIGTLLMQRQHALLKDLGYRHVETRTRAINNRMIMLNLRHGFHVAGFETSFDGIPIVTQRKALQS